MLSGLSYPGVTHCCGPVWPSGKALEWKAGGFDGFDSPYWFSFLFKCCGLLTLSCDW